MILNTVSQGLSSKGHGPTEGPARHPPKSLHPLQSLLDLELARLCPPSQHDRHTRARNETAKNGNQPWSPSGGRLTHSFRLT